MVKLLKYSWLIVVFVIAGAFGSVQAQDTPTAYLEGRITTASGKKLAGAVVTVKKNGSTFKTITIGSNGKYSDLELPMGFEYELTVSYEGYLSKTIVIDAKTGYFEEDTPLEIPMDIPFQLDSKKPDVDYSPVANGFKIGKLSIDPNTGGLAIDQSFTSSQSSKYKKFFEDLEKEANKEEEEFKKFIENGDKAFQAGNYTEAMTNYTKAKEIKSDDPGVATKITTTEQKIEQKKNFDEAVSAGDGALSGKNYDEAIAKYEKAKSIMPDDKTIDAKIKDAKAQKEAAEGAELDAKYNAKMDEANKAFADEDYGYAKTLYTEAGKIKPDEKEPPAKIKECDDIIKKQMEQEQAFNELVAAGDKGMLNEDYDTAIEKYTAALEIKKDDRVESELAKAKDLKKKKEEADELAAQKEAFDKLIADGDGKLGSEDFDAAIAKYTEALNTGFDNATANAKIKEAEDAKKAKEDAEAAAELKEQFEQFIADGDGKLGGEDFDAAIAKYTEALNTGFDNATANAKIKEAEDAKKAKEDAEAAAELKEQFEQFIADGDGKLGSEDFDAAIAKYTEALNTGFDNATANAKIKEAEDAKKAKEDADAAAELKEQFKQFIADGNDKLGDEDFDAAIAKYTEALNTGFDNATANAKIKEAEDAKKAKEDADAAAELQEQFEQFIADGDGKLGSEDFDAAIAKYTEALNTGFDNATANAKIQEAKEAKAAKNAADLEAANQEKFNQFIADGDGKLGSEDFDGAIAKYTEALNLEVDNATANAKIKEAEEAKAAYEAEMAAKNEEEQKQAQFDQYISAGDGKLGDQDFDGAIADYEAALGLDVNNKLANQKIEEAKDAKAAYEQDLADQDAAAKQAEFDKYINAGDGHLSSNAYDMAISEYESALALDVDNPTANAKIKEAKDAKAAYEAELAANEEAAAIEKEFNDLISKGDAAKDARDWAAAKEFYGQAKEVKNESPIPQQKIDEVNDLMKEELEDEQDAQFQKYLEKGNEITEAGEYEKAIGLYNKAKGLFPAKGDILDEKIAEVAAMKAKEDEYNKYMASADGLFEAGKWQEAKADYIKAKGVFDRPRPNEQIALIDQKIAEQDAANDQAAELAKLKEEYDALMKKAKSEKDGKQYQEAIATYTEAKNLMPLESEPQQRIDEINDLLSKMADQNALLEKYQAAIAKADAKRDEAIGAKSKELAQEAKGLYTEAYDIKSDETYPQEEVNKLNNLMTKWEDEDSQKQYQKIIDKADELFAAKNWDGAEELYNRAIDLGLNPGDPYPPAQLEKIKNARANAGKLDAYNEFIQEGNSLFAEKKYQKAIDAYEGALGVKPGAKYPKDKIAEIQGLMADASQAQKEKLEKENAIEIDPGYLGDEISMTEAEIEALWSDARVDEITDKDEVYTTYKEKVGGDNMDDLNYQADRTESINDTYEEMDQNIADQNLEWDQQRKDVLPEIEDYKEGKKNELANYYEVETNRSTDLNNYYDNDEQERSEYELSLDDKRKDNIVDMEVYKLEQSEIQLDLAESEVDVTYENSVYYEEYELEKDQDNLAMDERRKDNIVEMEDYKFDQSEMNLDLAEAELDVTYENSVYYEEYELEKDQDNLEMDERRKDNIVDMVDYKEIQMDINNDLIDQGVSTTYEVHSDYEQMEEEWEQFAEDGDIRRKEETVIQMDDYKETQMDINLEDKAFSVEKTDDVNQYNVEYHDYLEEFADDMDIPREDNVDAMEIYQNDRSDLYQDDLITNEERSQENYLDKNEIKEAQFGMREEESAMVENNTEDMVDYKDNKYEEGVALKQSHDGDGFDNSQAMDSVKAQKATMFSDLNQDALANQYPEGVTEKTFQRTNNLGEVVEITIVRIVVRGNKADEYRKVTSKWNTAYFKNGGIINEYIWDTETN